MKSYEEKLVTLVDDINADITTITDEDMENFNKNSMKHRI